MAKLTVSDIADLRAYEREREDFRRSVIELKRVRRVGIGPIVTVVFENALTLRFQIQEMARAERMLSDEAIQAELDVYNPLIPQLGELSMTMFIELTTEAELREWLPKLVGIERSLILTIGDGDGSETVRNEVDPAHASQLTRDEITASVHYVRISLSEDQRSRFAREPVRIGTDHPAYRYETVLRDETKKTLVDDWESV